MSRSGLFTLKQFFFNRVGRTVSATRDTRFGIGRTVPAIRDNRVRLVLFWFIVRRARRRTTDFVQMPPRLLIPRGPGTMYVLVD
jgi:hypothetical protein